MALGIMLIRPKDYFSQYSKRPKKFLGQHFLVQPHTAESIVEAAEIREDDVVVEIGPGLGTLTRYLLTLKCDLHLVEIDEAIAEALKENFPRNIQASVTFHVQDILKFDWKGLSEATGRKVKVLGNIPYNISSPIIFSLIENFSFIADAVLMVQREVGDRWCSRCGSKNYGVPSVLLACCSEVRKVLSVGRGQFFPEPRVDSVVVKISFFDEPLWAGVGFSFFREFISALFKSRRKTIMNSLKAYLKNRTGNKSVNELAKGLLERSGIDKKSRPEQIHHRDLVKLAVNVAGVFGNKI